jgi:hypothetical protein
MSSLKPVGILVKHHTTPESDAGEVAVFKVDSSI